MCGQAVEQKAAQFSTPYQFNGKELDSETGLYNYGARYYDPSLSLWLGVDPLADEMPEWSPYNYVFNNPVNMIDPDGRAPANIGVDSEGNVVFDDGKNDGNLFLVNDGAGEITNLQELTDNSTQLSKDDKWIGSDSQLKDYVISQMNHVDNINANMFVNESGGINISVKHDKNAMSVTSFSLLGNEESEINIKIRKEFSFTINSLSGSSNGQITNPYNTRNVLAHEGRHVQQSTMLYHATGGKRTRFNISKEAFKHYREYDAVQFQMQHSSWDKSNSRNRYSARTYMNMMPSGAAAKKNFLKMLRQN